MLATGNELKGRKATKGEERRTEHAPASKLHGAVSHALR
jgi:hypothetical protein